MKNKDIPQRIAMLILAAGASRRMEEIKQLLPWNHTTLLGHMIEQGLASKVTQVFVVLGAHSEVIWNTISNQKSHPIFNPDWEQGMGVSIASAMHYFDENSLNFDAVLIVLVDQPLLDSNYFNLLISSYLSKNKNIVASQIKNGIGVPVILSKAYFKELKKLDQDYGAKRIIAKNMNDVFVVNSEGKNIDIDTLDAYNDLLNIFGKRKKA